jgi:hypothetical protein
MDALLLWLHTTLPDAAQAATQWVLAWLATLLRRHVSHYVATNQTAIVALLGSLLVAGVADLVRWQLWDAVKATWAWLIWAVVRLLRVAFFLLVAYVLYPWLAALVEHALPPVSPVL